MSKAVLISIRPEWCEKIMEGRKTIEVRKTRPKTDTPFKCYIYCTQSADMLWILRERERSLCPDKIADVFKAAKCGGAYRGNGKIIGEFTCNRVTNLFSNSRFWLDEDDGFTHVFVCCGNAKIRKRRKWIVRLAHIQPQDLRYAEGTDRISHLEKMQIMQQKWVRKHSLYL